MQKIQHTHKYTRVILGERKVVIRDGKKYLEKTGGYPVMKCALPGCTHYIASDLAVGRTSLCWKCGSEFTLTTENVGLKRPCCYDCRRRKIA